MAATRSISLSQRALFWGIASVLLLGFVWLFSGVLLPFILGIAVAYLLEPSAEKLVALKLPRWTAAVIILFVFFLVLISILILALPFVYRELTQLAEAAPRFLDYLWNAVTPHIEWVKERIGSDETEGFKTIVKENIGKAFGLGQNLVSGIASGGQAFVGFITTFILTPIVAFFMIREWPALTAWVDGLLPRHSHDTICGLLSKIDRKISGFVRGQLTVAVILGLIYAVALTIAGLNFGFIIGLTAGFLSVIPLFGSTMGLLVSVVVAWFQTQSLVFVGIVAAIFMCGQFVEGNILSPRILGKAVGMHPLWVLFAVLAGGSLFGIVGMLLAVPIAAAVGVLVGFSIEQYKQSPYYDNRTTAGKKRVAKKPAATKTPKAQA